MKISVVVPTYNREKKIARAIDSVISQSYRNWELIIIDDASTDETEAVVRNYQVKDKRIIYKKLPENKGVNYARNRGVEISSGEWISFLDSDDEYAQQALSVIATTIGNRNSMYQFINFSTMVFNHNGLGCQGYHNFNNQEYFEPSYYEYIAKAGMRGDMHRCLKRSLFEDCNFPEYINGFEHLFYSKIVKAGARCLYVNKSVVIVHDEDTESLSKKPYYRWPLCFAEAYSEFVADHKAEIKKHPDLRRHYYLRIAKCYKIGKRYCLSMWWVLKLFCLQPIDFIKYLFSLARRK